MRRLLAFLFLFSAFSAFAAAQNPQRTWYVVQNNAGFQKVIPYAPVTLCTYNSALQCNTPVIIYSDPNLTVPIAYPFYANANGYFSYYALPGTYVEQQCIPASTCTSYQLTLTAGANTGVTQVVAGTNITISPTSGIGAVTISSTGGGLPSPAIPYGVVSVNPGATGTTSNGGLLYDPTCSLTSNPNSFGSPFNCLILNADGVGLTSVNPFTTVLFATGATGKGSGESPSDSVWSQYDLSMNAGRLTNIITQSWKGGVGDGDPYYVYWGGNYGSYYPSDQGGQGYVSQGGEGSSADFNVGTYSGNVLTIASQSCALGLPSQICGPGVGGWVIKDSNYTRTNLIGASATLTGNCGAAWLQTLTTGGGLPTTTVCGKALNVNLAPNVAWAGPGVSESITFTSGIGSFTPGGGDAACVMGSNWIEEAVTTSATGSAGTQTLMLPLTRGDTYNPNVSVVIFKGHCSILSMDADYYLSAASAYAPVTTSYPVAPSLDGTHLIYGVEGYGSGDLGSFTLPLTNQSAEVIAPAAQTSTSYTAGQFIYDGTINCEASTIGCVQEITTGGTSGSSFPTWNATVGGSTTWGGVTTVNMGATSIVHVYPAARVVQTNALSSAPYWSFTLAPNGLTLNPGDAAESPNFDWVKSMSFQSFLQCLTPSDCEPFQVNVVGFGLSGTSMANVVNQNPLSMYLTSTGLSTGVQPPSAYGVDVPYDGGSGLTWDTIVSAYAPLHAVFDVRNHAPGNPSYYLLSDATASGWSSLISNYEGEIVVMAGSASNGFGVENTFDSTYTSGTIFHRNVSFDDGASCIGCVTVPGSINGNPLTTNGAGGIQADADTTIVNGYAEFSSATAGIQVINSATTAGLASFTGGNTNGISEVWTNTSNGASYNITLTGSTSTPYPSGSFEFGYTQGFIVTPTYDAAGQAFTAPSLTGQNLTPGDCVQASGGGLLTTTGSACGSGGGISGLTANYIPKAGSATTLTANSALDDGVTTASTITSSEPIAVNATLLPSQVKLTYNAGHAPTCTSGAGVIAPDSTGNVDICENNGSFDRVMSSQAKGTFVCTSGGTITISATAELATSDVIISLNTAGGTISTSPAMKTVTPGTGFSVLCATSDTSTYNYNILP